MVVVVGNADLVDAHVLGQVGATLIGDADVDVVGKCLEQLLGEAGDAGRRRLGEQQRHDTVGWIRRDRQPGLAGAEHVDGSGRPEPEQEVGEVDDVVAVQMGEEDRADRAATSRLALAAAWRSLIATLDDALPHRSRRCRRHRRRRSHWSTRLASPSDWRRRLCREGSAVRQTPSATAGASGRPPSMARSKLRRGEEHLRPDTCSFAGGEASYSSRPSR